MKKISEGDEITLTQYIERCKNEIINLEKLDIVTVGSQTSELEIELSQKNEELAELEKQLIEERKKQIIEKDNLNTLRERLYIINDDIRNNKDVIKLKN